MADDWTQARAFYSALTLARDGDEMEQYGAENYGLNERWPAYEQFWRFHVAPATERPASIAIREGVSQLVHDLSGANYRTFCCVVSACDFTAMLQTDVSYERAEDWKRLLSFHAAAVRAFADLIASTSCVLTALELSPGPLPPDRREWRSLVDDYRAYHAYLEGIDPGSLTWISDEERRIAIVLSPEALTADSTCDRAADRAAVNHRARLVDAARRHLDDLIHLLNVGSGQLIGLLEPAQACRAYHQLWGWYRG
jgi:hypothetical protein